MASASQIVGESVNRLPMSLSTVIADMEAEGMSEISTACLVTSRSVTRKERQSLLETVLLGGPSGDSEEPLSVQSRAVSTVKGLALGMGQQLEEVVCTAVACQGLLLYYPSQVDLKRGEGLLDTLAPAMERLLQWQEQQHLAGNNDWEHKSCLVVICDPNVGKEETQEKLEAAATPILKTFTALSHNQQVETLQDVFSSVLYVTPDEVESSILNPAQRPYQTTTPEQAMASVASVVASDTNPFPPLQMDSSSSTKILTNPQELAAARNLEPAKRKALEMALQKVDEATAHDTQLVTNFGDLCDAVLKQANEQFVGAASSSTSSSSSQKQKLSLHSKTSVGKDLAQKIKQELASEWTDVYETQLHLLSEACFADFKQNLGKLRLGPTLVTDMQEQMQSSVRQFAQSSHKLLPKTLSVSGWSHRAGDRKAAYSKKLQEFTHERLQAAEASGQFKPVPRKGVTVGMHWLLPKPFGNDYRQEPWMVHASDNMVYVPRRQTKVTDIPGEDVKAGDWRDKIVPSPAGNDMLYMQ